MANKISLEQSMNAIILIALNVSTITTWKLCFEGCFTYNFKGSCYIYYLKTPTQKKYYKSLIKTLNNDEIKAEALKVFDQQERDKRAKWQAKERLKSSKPASFEVFWKNYKQKRNGKYKGEINNIQYTYECLKPYLYSFYREIML